MKTFIINHLEELVGLLSSGPEEEGQWREILVSAAECGDSDEFEAKVLEPVTLLLQEQGEENFAGKAFKLRERVAGFPADRLLRAALKLSGEMRRVTAQDNELMSKMISELATPVIDIWEDVLLVPLIGTLDSERAQNMAEKVLVHTSESGSKVVIIDITGVPVIDTVTGGYLIEMFNGIKLLGAEVVLCGIKPDIAQTLVKLDIDLTMVTIKRNLEDALWYATEATGYWSQHPVKGKGA